MYLLKSESYFNIKESDIPKLSADIVFYSQPFTLVFDIIIGYMHDKLGRRVTWFISTIVWVLAFVLLPFMKSVYPGLLIIRILLNFSLKGPITAPLSADYRKTLCPVPLNDRDPFDFGRGDWTKGISILGILIYLLLFFIKFEKNLIKNMFLYRKHIKNYEL